MKNFNQYFPSDLELSLPNSPILEWYTTSLGSVETNGKEGRQVGRAFTSGGRISIQELPHRAGNLALNKVLRALGSGGLMAVLVLSVLLRWWLIKSLIPTYPQFI